METTTCAALVAFRVALRGSFGRRGDALVELIEGLLTGADAAAGSAPASIARLSLGPRHRRGWGSAYAALRRGEVDGAALGALLARTLAPAGADPLEFAVDVSAWPRRFAATSPARGYWYHPAANRGRRRLPITEGWAYQWVARLGVLGATRSSWTAPVDVRRVRPDEKPVDVAGAQLRALAPLISPEEDAPRGPGALRAPLFTFDAGYDPAALSVSLADLPVETPVGILVRIRRHRRFVLAARGPRRPHLRGRDAVTFSCADPTTWPAPAATLRCADPEYGRVDVRAWTGLHATVRRPPRPGFRGTRRTAGPKRGPLEVARGTVLRVQVQRVPHHSRPRVVGPGHARRRRAPEPLWLWWHGPESATPTAAALDRCWRAYARRYDVEQTFRFLKQRLGWTTPRVRLPEQADRWSWLVAAAFAQLVLARTAVADRRLPWERPLPPDRLTPLRVLRAFVALAHQLPRVAATPRPCGRSPGRPKGRRSRPAPRYPPLKKAA
jgi:hypothetical protein